MLSTLNTLCSLKGVSGDENQVREYILNRILPYADSIDTDALGNIIVFKKGRKTPNKKIMLAAHMDEVGIIVTRITDDGYLKFSTSGGIDKRLLLGKKIFLGDKLVPGIIGNKAVHLISKKDREKSIEIDSMYIDIGAKNKDQAKNIVMPGDTGMFDPEILEFGSDLIKAKAIDDRAGCAVLIKLIESDLPIDTYFVFNCQEEVGCRGSKVAAYRVQPDECLVVEGTTAADLPNVSPDKQICHVGQGVVIPFMDKGSIYNRNMYKELTRLAESHNLKWQTKTYIAGGTDAQSIQRTGAGVKTAGIAVAIRNIHSPASVASKQDLLDLYTLAELYLINIGEK